MDKNYKEETVYKPLTLAELANAWLKLYDEYFTHKSSKVDKQALKLKKKTIKLLATIDAAEACLNALKMLLKYNEHYEPEMIVELITAFKNSIKKVDKTVPLDENKNLAENVRLLNSFVGALKTRYELNFKNDTEVNENETIMQYYEQKAAMESILKKDHISDATNMLQWIAYEKQAEEAVKRAESIKAKNRKNGR